MTATSHQDAAYAAPRRPIRPDPNVVFTPATRRYHWTAITCTCTPNALSATCTGHGTAETRGEAWYYAIQPSIAPLARLYMAGHGDVQIEMAVTRVERQLERACARLPETVNANFLLTLIGWRIKTARKRANLEARLMQSYDQETIEGEDSIALVERLEDRRPDSRPDMTIGLLLETIPETDYLRTIARWLAGGVEKSEIARRLDVAPSTITRRVERLREVLIAHYAEAGVDVIAGRLLPAPMVRAAA